MEKARDIADQVNRLEGALSEVKWGKTPHFGTKMGSMAEQYEKAAKALENSPTRTDLPSSKQIPGYSEMNTTQLLMAHAEQLRNAEEQGIAARARLDSEIELTERRYQAAVQIHALYQKLAGSPLYEQYVADYVDADQLMLAISSYKTSLERQRSTLTRGLKALQVQIENLESNLSYIVSHQDTVIAMQTEMIDDLSRLVNKQSHLITDQSQNMNESRQVIKQLHEVAQGYKEIVEKQSDMITKLTAPSRAPSGTSASTIDVQQHEHEHPGKQTETIAPHQTQTHETQTHETQPHESSHVNQPSISIRPRD